jgi:MFS family permease
MAQGSTPDKHDVQLRRSPKLQAFVLVFGLLGFFVTAIVTGFYPSDPSIGFVALFAYFALFGVSGSITIGVIVWLVIDMRSKKRMTVVRMERQSD